MKESPQTDALFESIHEQLFLAWAVSPSSWFAKPDEDWQHRVRFFVQASITPLLPLYAETLGYKAQLPTDTADWLIENARNGLSALARCIQNDASQTGFTVTTLANTLTQLEFECHANQRPQRYITLGNHIVSFQRGVPGPHVLTVDIHTPTGQYEDGFAIYTFSTDVEKAFRMRLPNLEDQDLHPLLDAVAKLATTPEDWPSFYRVLLRYRQPGVEELVDIGLLPEAVLEDEQEED